MKLKGSPARTLSRTERYFGSYPQESSPRLSIVRLNATILGYLSSLLLCLAVQVCFRWSAWLFSPTPVY